MSSNIHHSNDSVPKLEFFSTKEAIFEFRLVCGQRKFAENYSHFLQTMSNSELKRLLGEKPEQTVSCVGRYRKSPKCSDTRSMTNAVVENIASIVDPSATNSVSLGLLKNEMLEPILAIK